MMNAFTIPARSAMSTEKPPTTYKDPNGKHPGKSIYISSRDDKKPAKADKDWQRAMHEGLEAIRQRAR